TPVLSICFGASTRKSVRPPWRSNEERINDRQKSDRLTLASLFFAFCYRSWSEPNHRPYCRNRKGQKWRCHCRGRSGGSESCDPRRAENQDRLRRPLRGGTLATWLICRDVYGQWFQAYPV